MKRLGIGLLAGVILAGCSPSKGLEADLKTTPDVKPTTTAGTPLEKIPTTPGKNTVPIPTSPGKDTVPMPTGTTTTGATTGTSPTPPATITPDKSHDIPDRAFQLRSLQKTVVTANGHAIDSWVMDTDAKRGEGMMFLQDSDVKDDQGMIFVFSGPQTDKNHGFYMKNTMIPLDIIYIGADHKVLNIQEGKVRDESNLPPSGAFTAVLELKKGEAAKLGITHGSTISVPPDVHATT